MECLWKDILNWFVSFYAEKETWDLKDRSVIDLVMAISKKASSIHIFKMEEAVNCKNDKTDYENAIAFWIWIDLIMNYVA